MFFPTLPCPAKSDVVGIPLPFFLRCKRAAASAAALLHKCMSDILWFWLKFTREPNQQITHDHDRQIINHEMPKRQRSVNHFRQRKSFSYQNHKGQQDTDQEITQQDNPKPKLPFEKSLCAILKHPHSFPYFQNCQQRNIIAGGPHRVPPKDERDDQMHKHRPKQQYHSNFYHRCLAILRCFPATERTNKLADRQGQDSNDQKVICKEPAHQADKSNLDAKYRSQNVGNDIQTFANDAQIYHLIFIQCLIQTITGIHHLPVDEYNVKIPTKGLSAALPVNSDAITGVHKMTKSVKTSAVAVNLRIPIIPLITIIMITAETSKAQQSNSQNHPFLYDYTFFHRLCQCFLFIPTIVLIKTIAHFFTNANEPLPFGSGPSTL